MTSLALAATPAHHAQQRSAHETGAANDDRAVVRRRKVARATSPDCRAPRLHAPRAAAEREELEVHVERLAPPLVRRDRPQAARRSHNTTADWSVKHAPQPRTSPVFALSCTQNGRTRPPSRRHQATLAPHPRPPLSPAAQAFPTLFAPPRAPRDAPPRSLASTGQTPHPHDHHHGQGRHHRQLAAQNARSTVD